MVGDWHQRPGTDPDTVDGVAWRIQRAFADMSPQIRRAAQHVLDNPSAVAVQSMRALAAAAGVKPNTLVRLARTLGYASYEDLRAPFRERVRSGLESFPDRARWLQSLASSNSHGQLFSQMAAAGLANLEQVFSATSADQLRHAARAIVASQRTVVLGLGTCFALAYGFWYVARMALDNLALAPSQGGALPLDEVVRLKPGDVLLAMSFDPYRNEVVDSVELAREAGVTVVAVTDSRASPLALAADGTSDRAFVVPTRTPQFFPSMVPAGELLETLLAFIIAESDPAVVQRIDAFHRRRQESGVYFSDGGARDKRPSE